jgi:serine/threonine protein kinase
MIKNNRIKIGDFGIAISLSSIKRSDHPLKNTGTIQYQAPEVLGELPKDDEKYATLEPKPETDCPTRFLKSDIWSCGCVVYEMSTKQKAYNLKKYPEVYESVLKGKLPTVEGNKALRTLVHKMLVKNPQERPSAQDLIEYINEYKIAELVPEIRMPNKDENKPKPYQNGRFKLIEKLGSRTLIMKDSADNAKRFYFVFRMRVFIKRPLIKDIFSLCRKALKSFSIPLEREEIEQGAEAIRKLNALKSPFIVEYNEGFWESHYGPYFIVTEYYPVR